MKKDIHPKYFKKAKVHCACGNTFTVGATKEKIEVEICSNCHPFYTGSQQLIDTAGRAERFKERRSKASKSLRKKSDKKAAKSKVKTQKAATKKSVKVK